jgi:hypothetical protein
VTERERMAANLAARWPDGQCHYCLITAEHVDGDRIWWTNRRRNVCSRSQCVRRFWADVARAEQAVLRPRRKLTPAEVHARILAKRRGSRAASRSRRKGNAA